MIETSDPAEVPASRRWTRHLPLAVIVIVAMIGTFTLRDYLTFDTLRDNREALVAFRDANFVAMVAAFMVVYVLIVSFSLPGGAVASVTGGFLFGLMAGTVINVISATIGASVIFLAARWGLGRMLSAKLDASEGKTRKMVERLHENEISVLFMMRLVPVVPFFVANLLPALVGVKFRNFALTTALGIIPGGIVFTSIGDGVGDVFDAGESPDLSLLWEPQVIGSMIGLALLSALPILIKTLRRNKET
jgi:uncharacterized membrane protein YdjX (TVP38/TMEM64 family)